MISILHLKDTDMAKINFAKIAERITSAKDPEKDISDYKIFYKTYLSGIKARSTVLIELYQFCLRFQKINFASPFLQDPERSILEKEVLTFLNAHFSEEILSLYNKEMKDIQPKRIAETDKPWWQHLLIEFSNGYENVNEKYQQQLAYKKEFLNYIHSCLFDFGLHAAILKRDQTKAKRYSICLQHTFKSKVIISEYKLLLDPVVLAEEYLKPFHEQLTFKINGKLIPFKSIYSFTITSSLLKDDEIELFAAKNGIVWIASEDNKARFMHLSKDETDHVSKNPHLLTNDKVGGKNGAAYVDPARIAGLKKIRKKDFDQVKLVRLCEELNSALLNESYLSISLLLRSIIDHVPPYFNCKNFSEVANNYSGGTQSFKKAMKHLDNSLRNIADNNIHSHIRSKEVLPTFTQVDFRQDLDFLISEMIRIAK